jgi:predicted GNAT family acetyltransferase
MAPRLLSDGVWQYRLATNDDLPILSAWRAGYEIEALGQDPDKPDTLKGAQEETIKKIALREIFVLEDQGYLVSQANYNATLPDVYQIGGVWTPPHLRGRGYAKGVVAGALLAARNQGIKKAILFTKNPSAMKCYESLGFKAVDDYHISLFKRPIMLGKYNSIL